MNVCLLLDDTTLPRWQADALEHLREHSDVRFTTIVYNEYEPDRTTLDLLKRAIELREWTVVAELNKALRRSDGRHGRVDIDAVVDREGIRELSVEPVIVDGWKQKIPAETVDRISDDVDVAVRFGFGFLVGPILSELEYGVLSYHHGDLREYRGQPFGFWEFVNDDETAGITVQQLTEQLDAGQIAALKTVDIDDLHTWEAIKRRLRDESADMLTTAVEALRNGDVREPETIGELYTHPKGMPVLKFAVKNTKGQVLEAVRRT